MEWNGCPKTIITDRACWPGKMCVSIWLTVRPIESSGTQLLSSVIDSQEAVRNYGSWTSNKDLVIFYLMSVLGSSCL